MGTADDAEKPVEVAASGEDTADGEDAAGGEGLVNGEAPAAAGAEPATAEADAADAEPAADVATVGGGAADDLPAEVETPDDQPTEREGWHELSGEELLEETRLAEAQMESLMSRRSELMEELGEALYRETRREARFRKPHEALYKSIGLLEQRRGELDDWLTWLNTASSFDPYIVKQKIDEMTEPEAMDVDEADSVEPAIAKGPAGSSELSVAVEPAEDGEPTDDAEPAESDGPAGDAEPTVCEEPAESNGPASDVTSAESDDPANGAELPTRVMPAISAAPAEEWASTGDAGLIGDEGAAFCVRCGAQLDKGDAFCSMCGMPVDESLRKTTQLPRVKGFGVDAGSGDAEDPGSLEGSESSGEDDPFAGLDRHIDPTKEPKNEA